MFTQQILLIGTGNIAQAITMEIVSRMDSGYNISAFVGKKSPSFNYPQDVNFSDDYLKISEILLAQEPIYLSYLILSTSLEIE